MTSDKYYNLLDILLQTRKEFFNLTREQLLSKFEHGDNKIELVNTIKNFIFKNGFSIDFFNILSFINHHVKADTNINVNLFNELKCLMDHGNLNDENINYYWLSKTFEEICQYNFNPHHFLKCIESGPIHNKEVIDRSEFISLSKEKQIKMILSLIILNRLENVIVLFKLKDSLIDFNIIKTEYNNFYIYNEFVVNEKESEDNYSDLKSFKNELNSIDIINEEQAVNINRDRLTTDIGDSYSQNRRPISTKMILSNKILSITFWLPYKEKEVKKFTIDYDKLIHLFKDTSFETKFYLLERINDHKEMYDVINSMPEVKIKESLYKFILHKDKIIRYFFDILDSKERKDYNIAYNNLLNQINNTYIEKFDNIFCNYEFNKAENKIKSIVEDKNNSVFFVFDIKKAFYSLDLKNVNDSISSFLEDKSDSNVFFSILFKFMKSITKAIKHNYLPITSYSQFIFKLYFLSLFNNIKNNNFLTFVDDFVIYGTKEEVYKTFDEIKYILIKNNLSISSFNIYDKMFTDSIKILKREYKFNEEERIELFHKFNKNISLKKIKKQFLTSIIFGVQDEKEEYIKKINLDCPRLILYMLKNINENEEKVIFNNKIESKKCCSVCYENPKNSCLIPCGHMFCRACIKSLRTKKCPYCNLHYKDSLNLYDV